MRSEKEIAEFFVEKILTAQKTVRDAFREIQSIHGVDISEIVRKIKEALQDDDGYDDYSGVPLPDKPAHKGTHTAYIKAVMDYVTTYGVFPAELDPDLKFFIVLLLSMIVAGRYTWSEYRPTAYTNAEDSTYSISHAKLYSLMYEPFDALIDEVQLRFSATNAVKDDEDTMPGY